MIIYAIATSNHFALYWGDGRRIALVLTMHFLFSTGKAYAGSWDV